MKKYLVGIAIFALISCISNSADAQGACYTIGGEVTFPNGTVYFVCPMSGGASACAYSCGNQK